MALVLRVARAELQILPGTAGIRQVERAVQLGPGLLVDGVDILGAEYPAEHQVLRVARREWLGVIGVRNTPVRRTRYPVERVHRTVAEPRLGLGDVLRRALAVALGPADLAVEPEVLGDDEIAIEVDEAGVGRRVRAGDLIVD